MKRREMLKSVLAAAMAVPAAGFEVIRRRDVGAPDLYMEASVVERNRRAVEKWPTKRYIEVTPSTDAMWHGIDAREPGLTGRLVGLSDGGATLTYKNGIVVGIEVK